jgi:hypothetical protein
MTNEQLQKELDAIRNAVIGRSVDLTQSPSYNTPNKSRVEVGRDLFDIAVRIGELMVELEKGE